MRERRGESKGVCVCERERKKRERRDDVDVDVDVCACALKVLLSLFEQKCHFIFLFQNVIEDLQKIVPC